MYVSPPKLPTIPHIIISQLKVFKSQSSERVFKGMVLYCWSLKVIKHIFSIYGKLIKIKLNIKNLAYSRPLNLSKPLKYH